MAAPFNTGEDCFQHCPTVGGCRAQHVLRIMEDEQETGLVVLADDWGNESVPLPDLGNENDNYLTAVRQCKAPVRTGGFLIKRYACTSINP
jgi:hypothetical protein